MNQRLGIASSLALGASLILAAGTSAQMSPHPAHIHAGSCPEPGDVVVGLSDVSFDMNVDGSASAGPRRSARTRPSRSRPASRPVPLALADIVAGEHAINVHASADDLATYIACGDIGGTTIGAGDLPIGLGELNDSGASGVAWLHDNGDGTTTVSVFIVPPAGAMAPSRPAVMDEAVAIKDFAFASARSTSPSARP